MHIFLAKSSRRQWVNVHVGLRACFLDLSRFINVSGFINFLVVFTERTFVFLAVFTQ